MGLQTNEQAQKSYAELVKKVSPNSPIVKNCILAFLSGGAICTLGEVVFQILQRKGFTEDTASLLVSGFLIFLSAILTAFGIYGKLGKHCGAGTEVPITGFANSVVSPAIEYKNAGLVLGMAAKMFVIAGPVIVYGVLTSIVVGVVYYFLGG